MAERIDFTNCRVIPGRAYNGANGKKIAVEYDGKLYMLKFPPSGRNKPTELSCYKHYVEARYNLILAPALIWRSVLNRSRSSR